MLFFDSHQIKRKWLHNLYWKVVVSHSIWPSFPIQDFFLVKFTALNHFKSSFCVKETYCISISQSPLLKNADERCSGRGDPFDMHSNQEIYPGINLSFCTFPADLSAIASFEWGFIWPWISTGALNLSHFVQSIESKDQVYFRNFRQRIKKLFNAIAS